MDTQNLRCEYHLNPLGLGVPRPRLSWQLLSSRRGARQTAYQLVAALSQESLLASRPLLWDSGKVNSDQSLHVPYGGPTLGSRQRVYWRLRTWDESGQPGEWSNPAWFEMGLLSPEDWQASWIGSTVVGGTHTSAPCPYLRKGFHLSSQVSSARLYITALGLYEAYLNGQRVGQEVFTPGWTDYHKRVQVQVYEVTSLLREGPNTLGAILGDGWYCGFVGWSSRQQYGDRPKLLAQLEIRYTDGRIQTVASDSSWETALGPLLESDLLMGEAYDARLELPDWCLPSTSKESSEKDWRPVKVFPHPQGTALVASAGPAVRPQGEISPVAEPALIPGWPTDTWIFDFGQNLVGRVRLHVQGPAGTTLTLRFAEVLDENGELYTANLRTARQTDYYTLSGDPAGETYESHFTFHGFRYLELSGYPGTPTTGMVTAVVLHSHNPETLTFQCSHPLVDQLQHNILWGWKGNSVDIPTDCPQRNERLGWTGDAQVFVKTATYLTDSAAFFTKWVQDLADAQFDYGAIPDVAPYPPSLKRADGGPAWSDAFIIVPWTIWQQYGDTRILERHYQAMCRYLEYLVNNSPGLIRLLPDAKELGLEDGDPAVGGHGDWLAQDGSTSPLGLTPRDLIGTAFLAYDANLMSQMAAVLGNAEDAARFSRLFQEVRQAFIRRYLTPDGLVAGGTQTSHILALHFDLVPEALRPTVIASLVKDIQVTRGTHMSTGFVGTPYICQLLSDCGHLDLAYALLLQESFPSWLYSVLHGATTIWERWDGWTEERGFQDPGMNSFNHYAYGAIGTWMVETIAGIHSDPEHPGFKHILLHPRMGGGLTRAGAAYQSLYGIIKSAWVLKVNSFIWEVSVPPNTTATAFVPAKEKTQVLEGGSPAEDAPGVRYIETLSSAVVFELGSGSYRFEVGG